MTIPDAELEAVRAEVESFFPETVEILRRSATPDGGGGESATWPVVDTVRGRLERPAGDEESVGGRTAARSRWVLKVPHDADLSERDRVTVRGQTFEVALVSDQSFKGVTIAELEVHR